MNRAPAAIMASVLIPAAILALFHAGAIAAPAGKARLEVDGASVILRQNRAGAQKRAIDSGLRKAVFQAVRQSMGKAESSRYRPRIEGAILSEARRYVRSYRVLGLDVNAGARLLKVRLEVVVDLPAVDEAVRSLKLAKVKKGETRLLFLVEEQVLRAGAGGGKNIFTLKSEKLGTAERRLMLDFARAGYTPVNPRGQREPAQPGQIHAAVSGDLDAARALGSLYGCPFVITASAIVERERGGAVVGVASARVIRVDDGAVIAIRSRQVRLRRARGRRGYNAALASASGRLSATLIPEVRRVFPPPVRPVGQGARKAPRKRKGR